MLVLRSRFKLCVDQHPGYILQDVGQLSVRHPTLVICVVLRCQGRSSEPEVGPLSGTPKVGYQQLVPHVCTRCGGRSFFCIVSHFLSEVSHDVGKWLPIVPWYRLADCVIMMENCHHTGWCMCLAWWCWLLVPIYYLVCNGRGLWDIVPNQKGIVLCIITYTW